MGQIIKVIGNWKLVSKDQFGKILSVDTWRNTIVDEGLEHLLDVGLSAATQTATWYIGLTDAAPVTVAATDTMASHAGWAEVYSEYSEGTRQTFVDAGVSSKQVTNTASPAIFTFTSTVTVGGAFLTSNNTKNGSTGILFSGAAFSGGDVVKNNTETIEVTAEFDIA